MIHTNDIKNCQIVSSREAYDDYGFSVEGPIAFIFDLNVDNVAVLGYNALDDTWQFLEKDLSVALLKASQVSEMVWAATKFVAPHKLDMVAVLEAAFSNQESSLL